ncbi:aspartyl-tRNA(Asn)/glutamyl-tRNA(Gln) amidotransferase subunit B [Lewinella aquimaris]|uniref:Aspartyl/glutamyl-tRNA(Asn/Gln) amidotransferase subunit B n=1 Tax=Neolewinella aquimaris TaxID=1835722 RepID=A0A840E572_9BACT|nr:Asp-tRNA(Asn)/Glu-tRNA(Gln) amidotransferase subunit GatB [Neolewinella aquimaris]MBB4078297.1 aspartyl-tRNA(Asn)/glutamyl-tRNA(Gln) amidotransferase subunit B [Neolewinella aquimaris]
MSYETTIGLETHVQLATVSKAFCGDRNEFGAEPNRHISEVSLGYPGTLPFLNERQVEFAVRLGLALGSKINRRSTFDRKNYFYADLPKGYQITQDDRPICVGGALPIRTASQQYAAGAPTVRVQLHHIHMEEDAGKSIHAAGEAFSRVDLNRAGTPLLEVVTEPDLHSAEEVDAFMSGMRQLVRWLEISDGNMEEGSLRCDVNVSVRKQGQAELGTRCEIKNMNSMRFARRAIAYEVDRQIALLEKGESVMQQTRQFDPQSGTTSALREKENAHDYRYFPDPDLPPVVLTDAYVQTLRDTLGILPWEAYTELLALGLDPDDAALIGEEKHHYLSFVRYARASPAVPELAKLWVNRVLPFLQQRELGLEPEQFATLQTLIADGEVSAANAASRLLTDLLENPGDVRQRAVDLGLIQNTDTDFLKHIAREVIGANPDKANAYRKGKKGLIGFFMGEVMKKSGGSAEPKETQALLRGLLEETT